MFGSSLPPVVCMRALVLFTFFLCLFTHSCVHLYHKYRVVLFFVSCSLCCQFLWIVHFLLPFRYCLVAIKYYLIKINWLVTNSYPKKIKYLINQRKNITSVGKYSSCYNFSSETYFDFFCNSPLKQLINTVNFTLPTYQ